MQTTQQETSENAVLFLLVINRNRHNFYIRGFPQKKYFRTNVYDLNYEHFQEL